MKIFEDEKLEKIPFPEDWNEFQLGSLVDILGGYAFKSSLMSKEGVYQVLKMSNIYRGNLDLSRSTSFINHIEEGVLKYLLKSGDIILTLTGTNGKRDYGFSIQINHEKNLLLNQRLCKLKSKKNLFQNYLLYLLKSDAFLYKFFNEGKGGTGNQANVSISSLRNIKVLLPSLKEQKQIVSILSNWDHAIEKNEELLSMLKLRQRGLMQYLLTSYKRLSEFEEEWREYKYEDLFENISRNIKWDDNVLYDLISVRRRSGGLFKRESLYGHQILTKNLKTACEGDFLISKMQIVHGASGVVTKEFDGMKISGSYLSLRSKDENILSISFLNWISKTPYFYHQTFISSYGVHIEKMTFNFKSFLKLKVSLPCIEEQKAIAEVLNAADQEIKKQEEYLEQLKVQKKGLMQQLLTGKIRVTID